MDHTETVVLGLGQHRVDGQLQPLGESLTEMLSKKSASAMSERRSAATSSLRPLSSAARSSDTSASAGANGTRTASGLLSVASRRPRGLGSSSGIVSRRRIGGDWGTNRKIHSRRWRQETERTS